MNKLKKASASLLIALSLVGAFGTFNIGSETESVNLAGTRDVFTPHVDRIVLPPAA
ncbi:hypothetical protein [Jeotgalibacillus haloalkalitolerans]|uniref:Uncharacterized protein n=1 Tax=Jeotgalibacillus haloalkalitolerans TaxID=3104292 RepID=A0ABU5KJ59_9BACL|nr:hypothetical protein [Jeotgalibacillus sp. HH7-29]MDZ5711289.1 hypothetical protein [Jeotgalibacillus sp. HH7-29]